MSEQSLAVGTSVFSGFFGPGEVLGAGDWPWVLVNFGGTSVRLDQRKLRIEDEPYDGGAVAGPIMNGLGGIIGALLGRKKAASVAVTNCDHRAISFGIITFTQGKW